MVFVGIFLVLLGGVALLAGVAGGVSTMVKDLRREVTAQSDIDLLKGIEGVLNAFTELVKTLAKSPVWLALCVIGIALIAWGGALIGN